MNGMWCGSNVGSSIRNSIVTGSPFGRTRLPFLIAQPASWSICAALRSSARSWPEPSETGGTIGLAEHLVGHLAAKRLEQLEFVGARRALRHHVGVLEHRDGALVGAVHDGLVGPFEIEGVVERLAQPRIGELRRAAY